MEEDFNAFKNFPCSILRLYWLIQFSGLFKPYFTFMYFVKLSFDVLVEKEQNFDSIRSLLKILEPEIDRISKDEKNPVYLGIENNQNKLLRGES